MPLDHQEEVALLTYKVEQGGLAIWLGIMLLIIGAPLLFQFWPLGILLIALSVASLTSKAIFQLDLANQRYRKASFVLGQTRTAWSPLPENKNYLTVMGVNMTSNYKNRYNADASNTYKEYGLFLIYQKRKRLQLYREDSLDKAMPVAKKIALTLELDIYQIQSAHDKKWFYYKDLKLEHASQ